MIQVISPHLDDAVLSLGQFISTGEVRVVTVFAGIPEEGLTDYDRSCGFESSVVAMNDRRAEDAEALGELGARLVHLDYLDSQYRTDDIEEALTQGLFSLGGIPTFAPLGIGHPDHELVARCCLKAFAPIDLFLFEELPYRVLRPEEVWAALDRVKAQGFTVELYHPEQGPIERKLAAIKHYKSQFPDGATDPSLQVPERCWRVTR